VSVGYWTSEEEVTYYLPSSKLLGHVSATIRGVYSIEGPAPQPEPMSELLLSLPAPARNDVLFLMSRISQLEGQRIVVGLCSLRPFSLGELEELLGKSSAWIKRTYIAPALRDGELVGIEEERDDSPATYRSTPAGIARYRHALGWLR